DHGPRRDDEARPFLCRGRFLYLPSNHGIGFGFPCHGDNRRFSGVWKHGDIGPHVAMERGWFAWFKDFFPNGDMLIFLDESYARIGEGGNLVQVSHSPSFQKLTVACLRHLTPPITCRGPTETSHIL